MTRKYKINGWIDLFKKSPVITNYSFDQVDLDAIVTNANEIKIYLTPGRCGTKEEKKYHKIYQSDDGFTHFDILRLIQQTYWSACRDIWNNNSDTFSNLSLHTFNFDSKTNTVYPDTDS